MATSPVPSIGNVPTPESFSGGTPLADTQKWGIPALNSDLPQPQFAPIDLNQNLIGLTNTGTSYNPTSPGNPSASNSSKTASPPPKKTSASIVKEKLLKPALTSHFECYLKPPEKVASWMSKRLLNPFDPNTQLIVNLSCSETSLPGSRLATLELQDDHHGVTERHAYRRQFDDSVSFTFYVDSPKSYGDPGYKIIWFFEQWKSYIMGEGNEDGSSYTHKDGNPELDDPNWYYRARFPKNYQTDIFITKFERDYDLSSIKKTGTSKYLEYKFLQAFPISINTMPVSYDQSQLLKCTVSFAYSRYIVRRKGSGSGQSFTQSFLSNIPSPSNSPIPFGPANTPSFGSPELNIPILSSIRQPSITQFDIESSLNAERSLQL
jgi:hypothetical protein